MNIEITENIILGSIIYALSNHFGDNYHYYDEEIEQGFEKPSFHVQKIDDIETGVDTSDATALASDLLKGKTAYNAEGKIEGTLELKAGDRFCQGIFMEYGITYDDDVTNERNGGFGSTGSK